MCYYFNDIIMLEDFDLDNILIDKKSYENIFYFITFCKLIISLYVLDSIKQMDLLEFVMELDIQYYLEVKKMIPFMTGLDIL